MTTYVAHNGRGIGLGWSGPGGLRAAVRQAEAVRQTRPGCEPLVTESEEGGRFNRVVLTPAQVHTLATRYALANPIRRAWYVARCWRTNRLKSLRYHHARGVYARGEPFGRLPLGRVA